MVALNTFHKDLTDYDKIFIDHFHIAPQKILNDLISSKGYKDCYASLSPQHVTRTEELYYLPFKDK